MNPRRRTWCALLLLGCGGALVGCGGGGDDMPSYGGMPGPGNGMDYKATPLVSDTLATPYHDTHLVNGWGVAFNPQGFVWVANAGTSTSTLYDGNGVPQSLVVDIPAGAAGDAEPTGIVFNGSTDFLVTAGGHSAPAVFLFAGEAGTLSGWAPSVNATSAITVFDGATLGASYRGLALAQRNGANLLYAADFHNGRVDVFNGSLQRVILAGGFSDPSLPAGYAPFNIQAIGNRLYVAYAKQDAQADDEVAGAGLGIVNVFDTDGALVKRLVTGGPLNAPWGVALAPSNFGRFSGALLVGNFGDGRINAFDADTGALKGTLSRADGSPLVIDGLWGLAFGNGLNAQPTNTLFYAAGPNDETHGLYGRIDVD
jgi:uncharacterized protein (TIGR03118 family)